MEEGVRKITTWVGEARKVLVHCSASLSRSTTVVMAWLMSTHGMTLTDAVSTVSVGRGRPPCCNVSFWYKLAALERKIFSLADDAAPSHCFLDHVVKDLGTGSGGLGADEVEVRRLMPLRQWNAYAVLNEIMGSD